MNSASPLAAPRRGFLMMEVAVTLGIFGIALILTAQLATFAIAEQTAAHERLAAIEFADNVLETARAKPWSELTPEWAASQKLPEDWADRVQNPSSSYASSRRPIGHGSSTSPSKCVGTTASATRPDP